MSHRVTAAPVILALFAIATQALAQDAPTLLRGPYLQLPTPDSIVVRWRTSAPTDSRVRFGTNPANLDRQVTGDIVACATDGAALICDHELALTGLAPATRYYYAVGSTLMDLSSGADHTFVTPPANGTRQPIRIWAFGDSGASAGDQAPQVRDAYLGYTGGRGTDAWVLLGDNSYFFGTDAEYQAAFFDTYPGVLRQVAPFSTFGNHENYASHSENDLGPYYDMFTFPQLGEAGGVASGTEAYYSFDHGNVHFISLNSQDLNRVPPAEMLDWLQADLAANEKEWTIAFFHHPVYSWGSHNSDTDTSETNVFPPTLADDFAIQQMREHFVPVLEAGGADLVLTGHSHQYERSKFLNGHYGTSDTLTPDMVLDGSLGDPRTGSPYRKTGDIFNDGNSGTVYAVVGTGAESVFAADLHPAMAITVHSAGSLVIDVDGPRLEGTFVDTNGVVRDRFTILRGDNVPPVANDDQATTLPATAVDIPVLANDVDYDDDLLRVVAVSPPTVGTAIANGDGTITYTPPRDLADGIATFTYTIDDGQGHRSTANVTVTITCPPLAEGAFFDDFEPGAEPGWTQVNAQPPNPLSPEWAVIEEPSAHSPTHAFFSAADSNTSYKDDRLMSPPMHLSGSSRLTFWHRHDLESEFDGGMIEISTDGGATWTDLGNDIVTGGYNQSIWVATNPPTDQFRTFRPVWSGNSGAAMSLVEVDLGDYAGADRRVRWRLSADSQAGETGWFVDDVQFTNLVSGPGECNLPPDARDDEATTEAGTSVVIDVLANDSDPDGDPLQIGSISMPGYGVAMITGDQRIEYTPDDGFSGTDHFVYEATDGQAGDTAKVTVTVTGPPIVLERLRGNGAFDATGAAEFAMHVRRTGEGDTASGWVRYRTDADGGAGGTEIELRGWARTISFPAANRAHVTGACWLDDEQPCTFDLVAEDNGHPGRGIDRFGITIYDATGDVVHAADGVLAKGHIKLD